MNIYVGASVTLALVLYVYLAHELKYTNVKQNIATWVLWGALDGEEAVALFVQNGNWYLPAIYVLGCIVTITAILYFNKRTLGWSYVETVSTAGVVVCIIAWAMSGPWLAAIIATLGTSLATAPQIKDSWRKPEESPLLVYIGFVVVNLLSVVGGKEWSVTERLYPTACTIVCLLVVGASLRNSFRPSVQN